MKNFTFNKLALAVAFTGGALVGCDSDYNTSAVKTQDTARAQGDFVVAKMNQDTTASYQLAQADMDNEPTATDRWGVENEQQESADTESWSDSEDSDMDVGQTESQSDSFSSSQDAGEEGDEIVQFEFDSDELSEDAKDKLRDFVESHDQDQLSSVAISIKGYTDQNGPEEYNKDLAQRRAEAVRDFLQEEGLASSNLTIEAVGEPEEGELADSAQQNRRVVITVEEPDQQDEIS